MAEYLAELTQGVAEGSLKRHEGEESRDERFEPGKLAWEQHARGDASHDDDGHVRPDESSKPLPCFHADLLIWSLGTQHTPRALPFRYGFRAGRCGAFAERVRFLSERTCIL